MHAFVATVLLGVTRLAAFDVNPDPEPPARKLAQLEVGVGGSKGNTVVGTNAVRQSTFQEELLKGCKSQVFTGGFECLTHEEIARGVIGDGQGIAVGVVAELKFTLVIGTP